MVGSPKRILPARRPVQREAYLRGLRLFRNKRDCEDRAYLTHHAAVSSTCTAAGSIEYWECSICGKKFSDEACTTEVNDVTTNKLPHNLTKTDEKAATCTADGNTEYWVCSACNTWFSDENGEHEITDHNSVVIPKTGHTANETGWYGDDTDHWQVCDLQCDVWQGSPQRRPCYLLQEKPLVCGLEYGSTTDHDYQWHDDKHQGLRH